MLTLLSALRDLAGSAHARRELLARFPTLQLGRGVDIRSPERFQAGDNVILDVGAVLHCGGMGWAPDGRILLGDRCYVGPHAVLFGGGGIVLGRDVLVSPGVVLTSHQHTFSDPGRSIGTQPLAFGAVEVEDDVWIGANAVILPGVRLGRGCVVGAGAVVTRDVAPGTVALGVPARGVRSR